MSRLVHVVALASVLVVQACGQAGKLEDHLTASGAVQVRQALKALGLPAMDGGKIESYKERASRFLHGTVVWVTYHDNEGAIASISNTERMVDVDRRLTKSSDRYDSDAKWIQAAHAFAKKVWNCSTPSNGKVKIVAAGTGIASDENMVGVTFSAGTPSRAYFVAMDRVTGEMLEVRRFRQKG